MEQVAGRSVIEVFADVWCPFTHVGLRLVADRRALLGRREPAMWVRAWPLELVNGRPMDPGAAAANVHQLRAQVAPGLFTGFREDHFPRSTLPALALAARAHRRDPAAGELVSLALREALFERGEDISDPAVLADLAADAGLGPHWIGPPGVEDYADVLADWRAGVRRGVKGSPHFFCGAEDVFCPSLEIARQPGEPVAITRTTARLEAFLDRCLAAGE